MRHAYPLIWCLPEKTQAKLLGELTSMDILPLRQWSEWRESPSFPVRPGPCSIDADINYDKFIRQAPSTSRG